MTSVLDHLPKPQPDIERFKTVLRNEKPDCVPLVELAIDDKVLSALAGGPLPTLGADPTAQQLAEWATPRVDLWHRLGYDYYRVSAVLPFTKDRPATADTASTGQREWVDTQHGAIKSAEDVERYPWPTREKIGFAQARAAIDCLPAGMGAIGFCGGVLEFASELVGLENFALMLYDDIDLVRQVVERVGQTIFEAFETFCQMDAVFALWLGDDMGFKTSTLINPKHLRELILPWHKKYAELAHNSGRFFMLHSCGQIEAVMADLVNDVKIDARHSYEDVIVPVEKFKQQWGGQIAVLGGVDVDILSRGTTGEICDRTNEILTACAADGGYACGSGNSITNYVPPENYLAMVETVHRFNGRM